MTYKRTIIIIVILLVTAALTGFVSHSERIEPNKPFKDFPLEIGQWKGSRGKLDKDVYNILGVEDYVLANYRRNPGELINLYVGFYQSQKEGDIIHSPKNCLPGSGWNITGTSIETVNMTGTGKPVKVIKLLLQKGAEKQVVLYWFQSRGRIISSEYMQKVWLVVDSITKHRTDGSFVRLISPVTIDEKTTLKVLKEFANEVYPVLKEHIPS
ncbi:MAG: EpsI family protein [Deltaproteobacteria bacterium]|nr:EpsI family protein [Deltaproteobacteria bacterium]